VLTGTPPLVPALTKIDPVNTIPSYLSKRLFFVIFRDKPVFYGDELLGPRPTPKLEDHPLSALRYPSYLEAVSLTV
jgi:hypothetical protein